MRMIFVGAALLALTARGGLAAGVDIIEEPGVARMTCQYTVECLEEEECTFAQFGHDLALPKTLPGEARLQLGTGEAEGHAAEHNGVLVTTATDDHASYMLTQTLQGFAKLSVHFAEPLTVVTYHGSCQVSE